jgi:hypothetical protein
VTAMIAGFIIQRIMVMVIDFNRKMGCDIA